MTFSFSRLFITDIDLMAAPPTMHQSAWGSRQWVPRRTASSSDQGHQGRQAKGNVVWRGGSSISSPTNTANGEKGVSDEKKVGYSQAMMTNKFTGLAEYCPSMVLTLHGCASNNCHFKHLTGNQKERNKARMDYTDAFFKDPWNFPVKAQRHFGITGAAWDYAHLDEQTQMKKRKENPDNVCFHAARGNCQKTAAACDRIHPASRRQAIAWIKKFYRDFQDPEFQTTSVIFDGHQNVDPSGYQESDTDEEPEDKVEYHESDSDGDADGDTPNGRGSLDWGEL